MKCSFEKSCQVAGASKKIQSSCAAEVLVSTWDDKRHFSRKMRAFYLVKGGSDKEMLLLKQGNINMYFQNLWFKKEE